MKQIAGVEVANAMHFETPSGGEVIIGQCVTAKGHMIVFAHIDLEELPELIEGLRTAYLSFAKPEGEA
jgi:hypothetical protein